MKVTTDTEYRHICRNVWYYQWFLILQISQGIWNQWLVSLCHSSNWRRQHANQLSILGVRKKPLRVYILLFIKVFMALEREKGTKSHLYFIVFNSGHEVLSHMIILCFTWGQHGSTLYAYFWKAQCHLVDIGGKDLVWPQNTTVCCSNLLLYKQWFFYLYLSYHLPWYAQEKCLLVIIQPNLSQFQLCKIVQLLLCVNIGNLIYFPKRAGHFRHKSGGVHQKMLLSLGIWTR